jgi:hypothetical protein
MSKSSKTAIAAASGFILLLLMLYFTFYFTPHDKILDAEYNSWLDNKFKPQVIKGVVKSFEAYNDKDEFHDLEIQNGDETLSYAVYSTVNNKKFRQYIAVGDSVIKPEGTVNVTIKKAGGSEAFNFAMVLNY